MPPTVANAVYPHQSDERTPAPREVRKPDPQAEHYRVLYGAAVHRARVRCDWNLQEFAREMGGRNERLCARWESGEDRAPIEVLLAHDTLRPQLIIALAELSNDSVEIETTVRIRRRV